MQIVVDMKDIDKILWQINKAGGATILPKTEIEGGPGFYVIFRDPNNKLSADSCKALIFFGP